MLFLTFLAILLLQDTLANNIGVVNDVKEDVQFSGAIVTALLERIDKLEEKLEERDRQHTRSISILREEYQKEMASVHRELAKQKKRISWLEGLTKTQQKKIKSLLHDPTRVNQAIQDVEKDVEQQSVAEQFKQRIRRAELDVEVAFSTAQSKIISHLGAQQNVVFDTVITNIGNGYNPHVGSFIAPVGGTYVFSVTIMTESQHVSHYGLYKNSALLVRFYVNGAENHYDSYSQTVVVRLAQGDDVTVRHLDSDHSLHGDLYNTFSGFLLSQDFTGSPAVVGK